MEGGGWRVEDGGWRVGSGGWRAEGGALRDGFEGLGMVFARSEYGVEP